MDSNTSNDEFVLVNNVLKARNEYEGRNQKL